MWHNRETLDQGIKLAEDVAAQLGYAVEVNTNDVGDVTIYLVKDGIFRLNWHQNYQETTHIKITAKLPADPHGDLYGLGEAAIKVSISRTPTSIAKDITRRLLEEYEPLVETAILKITEGDKKRNRRDALAADIHSRIHRSAIRARQTSGVRYTGTRQVIDLPSSAAFRGEIEIANGYADVKIHTESEDFLRELADLIAKHQG